LRTHRRNFSKPSSIFSTRGINHEEDFLVTALLALFAFAILATTFDNLAATPSGQSQWRRFS
jgi:hypothetical protein